MKRVLKPPFQCLGVLSGPGFCQPRAIRWSAGGHPLGPLLAGRDTLENADWPDTIPRHIRRADVPALPCTLGGWSAGPSAAAGRCSAREASRKRPDAALSEPSGTSDSYTEDNRR